MLLSRWFYVSLLASVGIWLLVLKGIVSLLSRAP